MTDDIEKVARILLREAGYEQTDVRELAASGDIRAAGWLAIAEKIVKAIKPRSAVLKRRSTP